MNRIYLAALSVLFVSSAAVAQEQRQPAFEVTLFGGYRYGGEFEIKPNEEATNPIPITRNSRKLKLQDAPFAGLTLNFEQTDDAYYELTYSRQDTKLQGDYPVDVTVEYLHLGGIVLFPDSENDHAIPFFGMTFGGTRFTIDGSSLVGLDIPNQPPISTQFNSREVSETDFSLGVAGGFKFPITRHIGLRLEGRGYFTFVNSDSEVFCASAGGAGTCAFRISGNSFFQAQAMLGVTAAF